MNRMNHKLDAVKAVKAEVAVTQSCQAQYRVDDVASAETLQAAWIDCLN